MATLEKIRSKAGLLVLVVGVASLTADTWITGRMVARRIACRRNSDWLIP